MLSHETYAIVRMTLQNVVSLLCKPKGFTRRNSLTDKAMGPMPLKGNRDVDLTVINSKF